MRKLNGEDSIPFLHSSDDNGISQKEDTSQLRRIAPANRLRWIFGVFIVILVLTNVISLFLGSRLNSTDRVCAIHTSQHENVILRDLKISYSSIPFNGSFSKETIYRQQPSPEVDAAWLDLGIEYDPLIVLDEEAEAAGIEKDRFHVTERYGGPGFPAFVAGLHQLHCLNLLRKSLYFNVDYYRALHQSEFLNQEETLRLHIGHCMDIIRQRLMCTADTELHPYIWAGDPPHITPDFNRMYKCKNYEDIREYAKQHQAQWGPKGPNVVPGEGELILDRIP